MSAPKPDKMGPYVISAEIGRGGMGVVYKGRDPVLERTVAIKTIRTGAQFDDQSQYDRLLREARSAAGLSHPNIVTVYQAAVQEDCVYIAMEYVEGPTLEQWLNTTHGSELETAIGLLRQVAAGLDYAHRKGIIHRDVKPLNILIDDSGTAHITDFGLAKGAASVQLTQTGMQVGTPQYVSPEQAQGKKLDGRSDQFALAVIAFRALTGHPPFEAEEVTTLLFKIVFEECPSALGLNSALPPRVDAVLKRGLAKDPEARFGTCTEFIQALEAGLREPAAPPIASPAPAAKSTRKIAIGIGAALGCLAVMAGTGALFTKHESRSAAPASVPVAQTVIPPVPPPSQPVAPPPASPETVPVKTAPPPETKAAVNPDRPTPKRAVSTTPAVSTPSVNATPAVTRPAARGMADWEKPGEWVSESGWLVHKGGNFVLFGPSGQAGSFIFSAVVLKGKRLQWVINYEDPKNYAVFQIEKRQFIAKDVVNGSSKDRAKVPIEPNPAFFQISISLSPHQLVTSVHEGQGWNILDTWRPSGRDLTRGKFGFLIPGSDQFGLANFQFTPN